MSRTLTLSDALYARLETTARKRGLSTIEQLLEELQPDGDDLASRQATVRRIDALQRFVNAVRSDFPNIVWLADWP